MMTPLRRIAATTAAALMLAACSPGTSGNGIKEATVQDIIAKVTAAVAVKNTVQITGNVALLGKDAKVDVKFDASGKAATGTLVVDGGNIVVIAAGGHAYLTLDQKAVGLLGLSGIAAAFLAGQCIDVGQTGSASGLIPGFAGKLLGGNPADVFFKDTTVTKGAVVTVNGAEAQALNITDATAPTVKTELDIATNGDPLPVRAVITDSKDNSTSTLTFANWGTPVSATAPTGCLDVGSLGGFPGGTGSTPSPSASPTH